MRKLIIVLLLLCCYQAEAGEWFKYISIEAGLGIERFHCRQDTCQNDFDISDGVIAKFVVDQSIYSDKTFSFGFDWTHMSGASENTINKETPIDYFGFNIKSRFDWY